MQRTWVLAALIALSFAAAGFGFAEEGGKNPVYYVCGCEGKCGCDTIAKEPGACACGAKLVAMRLLTVEKDTAIFCRCGAGCSCAIDPKDPERCGCGKPLKKIGVKGRYKSSGCLCGGLEYTLDI